MRSALEDPENISRKASTLRTVPSIKPGIDMKSKMVAPDSRVIPNTLADFDDMTNLSGRQQLSRQIDLPMAQMASEPILEELEGGRETEEGLPNNAVAPTTLNNTGDAARSADNLMIPQADNEGG